MMIFVFLAVILLGLVFFGFVFVKELKSGALDEVSSVVRAQDPVASPEIVPGGILGERCVKLEQLLEEKNHSLERLEKELAGERAHRGEFESLKEILQRQGEDLRAQNKKLKEDLSKALQENISLRSGESGVKKETPGVSLHDVFEDNKKKDG